MANENPLLEISRLKPFESDCSEIYGPAGLNMKINVGDFLVVLGKSGHGKSTLIELLLGTRPREEEKND